jgi:glutamyl-tRNA synthetase
VTPRLRFAPSPTGYLHVGGARTALFNWLYARRHGGAFVLRIEDTDVERSQAEMVTGILDGLRWLGIDWDEGPEIEGPHAPYFQSLRLDRYRAAAKQLLESGQAFEDGGAIRFKVPPGKTQFTDSVHGPIEFDNEHIESFVILRSDTHPTYHLSVVVDDIDMAITHVVRGDDHISNTPKQVLLYNAFGKTPPSFAHVPLIMGPDKQRLSKRHGATSVMEYEKQGYIPEAMFNFLALLGWGTGSNDELFTRDELIQRFNLEGISGGNAVFNTEKLDWFNHQHLLRLADEELIARLMPLFDAAGYLTNDLAWLNRILALLRPRAKRLTEFVDQIRPFFVEPSDYDAEGVKKHLSTPGTGDHIRALRRSFAALEDWAEAPIEKSLRDLADQRTVKAGVLIHGTRIAMTGRMVSPGLFEMLVLMGRETVLRRLDKIASVLS